MGAPSTRRRGSRVDLAVVAAVRLATEESWAADAAAERLYDLVPDRAALRRARARVVRALALQGSPVGERAASTLDAALARAGHAPIWPRDHAGHRAGARGDSSHVASGGGARA